MKVATFAAARFRRACDRVHAGLAGSEHWLHLARHEVRRHGGSLGGYAKVCAAWSRAPKTRILKDALAFAYANGTVYADDVAEKMDITLDEAIEALYVLEEWGCLVGPKKTDEHNVFRTRTFKDKRKGIDLAEGHPCPFDDAHELYLAERAQTYRAQPFWKRCVILLAGIFMNLLFAIVAFVLIYSVFGIDMVNEAGEVVRHVNVDVGTAISAGFNYIGMVVVAVAGLFNPQLRLTSCRIRRASWVWQCFRNSMPMRARWSSCSSCR